MLLQNGARVTTYPVSTSKFGLGDGFGRMTTPIGSMAVAQKIGDHRSRRRGLPQSPVHRRDSEAERARPRSDHHPHHLAARPGTVDRARVRRCIYIHGTTEEKKIGQAGELRLHSDEDEGCRGALQPAASRREWCRWCRRNCRPCAESEESLRDTRRQMLRRKSAVRAPYAQAQPAAEQGERARDAAARRRKSKNA